jgi:alanine dehydrogenase
MKENKEDSPMIIGIPKEIKNNEYRVAITPAGVAVFVKEGHQVIIENDAGIGSGFTDNDYKAMGAKIANVSEVWSSAEFILKVKEPLPSEYMHFRNGLILFTYLHLAAEPALARALMEKGVIALAYETVEVNGTLPLLTPMSEVAGRMSVQIGSQFLEKSYGGKGILLSGVPGVRRGQVTIIGGGIVGTNAAKMAIGLGANVTIIDLDLERLRKLEDIFGSSINTIISNSYNIFESIRGSDLVIGAVLIPGAKAPKLVTEEMIKSMNPGSVVVDVAIDQGGIFETIDRITTHDDPVYVKHGVVHYAVANIPGAVPRTSTSALTNVTLPFALELANKGIKKAISENISIFKGLNVADGVITCEAVAVGLGLPFAQKENFD